MLKNDAIELLKRLIETPSLSREEAKSADIISTFLQDRGVEINRSGNNIWAFNSSFSNKKRTILLNSHHDTVPANSGYTKDPYKAIQENGKLYGLGSNDALASVVSLISLFLHFNSNSNLPYNLCLLISAEEEISGKNGVESVLPLLGDIWFGVVGEPTKMEMAVAERGLMVLDCEVEGVSSHAANDNGINPIHLALKDLLWFSEYKFDKISERLGEVKMGVTIINSGEKHNVIPQICRFTVDVRGNGLYSNEEILEVIKTNVACKVMPRSTRLSSSSISLDHPFVDCVKSIGIELFGSKTISDQALMRFDSVKMGVGDSLRSHTADEYIYIKEVEDAIDLYIKIFTMFFKTN